MKTTYNEILNKMKTAFFESCGEKVTAYSDVSVRLEAAASELFALACEADYVLKQAFPQTATGAYLDRHAELRDIRRKDASKALGTLIFSVNEAAAEDIPIPKGTLCSKEGEPFVQFETLENAVIAAGETEAEVPAAAVECGREHNAPAGTVTVMVNPPAGVDSVTNALPFSGGSYEESDGALRKRLLSSYRIPQTGYSLETVKTALLKNPALLDCMPTFYDNEIYVLIRLKSGCDFNETEAEIQEALALSELFGCNVSVCEAQAQSFSLTVEITAEDTDRETTVKAAKKAIDEYVSGIGIGEDVYLNRLVYCVSAVPGVSYCEVSSPDAADGIIICEPDSFLSLNSTEVNCYEQYI